MRLLTLARDLKRRKARERQHLFVAEGVRAVEELLGSPLRIRGALTAAQLLDAPRGAQLAEALRAASVPVESVEPGEFGSAAETESPQGVVAIAEVPQRSLADLGNDWTGVIVVLDAVQDPGNVGTIVRTAAALGAVATITLPGTVDLWNAKVVRSGMGAHFRHPAFASTWNELDSFRERTGTRVFAADAGGEPVSSVTTARRMALIVGNEGAGLSPDTLTRADRLVALPLVEGAESLNVAVATGILLYQFCQ